MGPIVVGVDGSERSREALRWALAEARLRRSPLEVVHAWEPPRPDTAAGLTPGLSPLPVDASGYGETVSAVREAAEQLPRRMLVELREEAESVDISASAVQGDAAGVLVEASARAELVVVGSRGHSALTELLLGSVSGHVVHHARCPVVVVPQSSSPE